MLIYLIYHKTLRLSTRCSHSRQGFSKVCEPSKGLLRIRGKAANLASDVRNLMQIHQGEDQGVEDREHVGHGRKANAAAIFLQEGIAPPMQTIFHGPMPTIEVQETLWRTSLGRTAWVKRFTVVENSDFATNYLKVQ